MRENERIANAPAEAAYLEIEITPEMLNEGSRVLAVQRDPWTDGFSFSQADLRQVYIAMRRLEPKRRRGAR